MAWQEVREPGTNKLLFRFDAEKDIVEIQRRGNKTVVELKKLRVQGLLVRGIEGKRLVERDNFGKAFIPVD